MKRMTLGMVLVAGLAIGLAGTASAQDRAGMALGGFYETRVDNNVNDEDLSFDYYGVRFQLRDERWFIVFVDLGVQEGEWGNSSSDAAGAVGLGGTLWLVRAEDLEVPLDLGLYGSFHRSELDLEGVHDATYTKSMGQFVVRAAGYGAVKPFLRAGVMKSKLDGSGLDEDDWEVVNPAVNVGLEIEPNEMTSITLEGNYSESAGFAIHCDFWF